MLGALKVGSNDPLVVAGHGLQYFEVPALAESVSIARFADCGFGLVPDPFSQDSPSEVPDQLLHLRYLHAVPSNRHTFGTGQGHL